MPDLEADFFKDMQVINDPRSYFHQVRSKCPVMREKYQGTFMVTGYDQVSEVLSLDASSFERNPPTLDKCWPTPWSVGNSDGNGPEPTRVV